MAHPPAIFRAAGRAEKARQLAIGIGYESPRRQNRVDHRRCLKGGDWFCRRQGEPPGWRQRDPDGHRRGGDRPAGDGARPGHRGIATGCHQREGWNKIIVDIIVQFGRLDILINNAGIAILGDITEIDVETWTWQIDVDLSGAFLGCRAAASVMRDQHAGCIINMSSVTGLGGAASASGYWQARAAFGCLPNRSQLNWALTVFASIRSSRASS